MTRQELIVRSAGFTGLVVALLMGIALVAIVAWLT